MVWGLDLVGPLQREPESYTHLLVTVDKFAKWIEARSISTIKSEQAVLFFLDIIRRFGVPNSIIMNNDTQFSRKKVLQFYDKYHIHVDWATVAHPLMNGQVKRANGVVLQGLKPRIFNRLNKFGRRWVTELPTVLWSLRTTPSWGTSYTPFFMVNGSEAILPTDLEYRAPRVRAYNEQGAKASLEYTMD